MARSVPEWIGATLDTPVPPRVRARVLLRDNGHCRLCTRRLGASEKWICDHIIAIVNGGENRESNLQTICGWCDKNIKTPADVAEKSKVARQRTRHAGIRKPRSITRWRKFNGDKVEAPRQR